MKKLILFLCVGVLATTMTSCYDFNREQAEKDAESKGKQTLLEAESSRKAKIEEAKADLESAKLSAETKEVTAKANAKAKIIEAEAEAQRIETVNKAIKSNPEYLKYKWIESISKGKSVFIPTEAGMPIFTEAK